ncbi:MAG: methyltransferase domain-containing protein [Thermoguttaceae bacterium]
MKHTDQNENEHIWSSFYKYLQERVEHLETKYPSRPKAALLSLMFWSFKQLLRSSDSLFAAEIKRKSWWSRARKSFDETPRILFQLKGGVGDLVISCTYLKEFYKFIGGTHKVSICTDENIKIAEAIFYQSPWVERIYSRQELPQFHEYDAVISFCTVPSLIYRAQKSKRISSPQLDELLQLYQSFKQNRGHLCSLNPAYAPSTAMYFLMNGHTRHSQTDVGHLLGISADTRPMLVLDETSCEILEKTGLGNRTYITVQRGVHELNRGNTHTRVWPKTYYNALIAKIHSEFPSLTIVQVGRTNSDSDLVGIDVDLRGQTSFEELKFVLKNSALHIDGECGMVHLMHSLMGRSAVFFGPTNIDFFGYPENINVKAKDACPLWCEWVTGDWQTRCLRGFDVPPCMEQLTPELFFDAIHEHLQTVANEEPNELRETAEMAIPAGTILFIGDFSDEVIAESVRTENRVFQFSMNLTPASIRNKAASQITADYAGVLNIPMKKASCDAVFCSQATHLSQPAMRELTRILKSGGVLQTSDERYYVKEYARG